MTPLFDYKCPACNHAEHDTWVVSIDAPLPLCECGAEMRKTYPIVNLRFRGDGFYVNDYKESTPEGDGDAG